MSSALKNLAALKRNISKRLKQALQELQENLGREGFGLGPEPQPARIPVTVPAGARPRGYGRMNMRGNASRNPCFGFGWASFGRFGAASGFGACYSFSAFSGIRQYSQFFGANHSFGWSCRSSIYARLWGRGYARFRFNHFRKFGFCPFTKFAQHANGTSRMGAHLTQGFAAKGRYQSSSLFRSCKVPTIMQLSKKDICQKSVEEEDRLWSLNMQSAVAQLFRQPQGQSGQTGISNVVEDTFAAQAIPSTIRTSISCSPKYHELVKRLAAVLNPAVSESSESQQATHKESPATIPGVYVDFRFGPRLSVPQATVLSTDVVDEMIDSLRRYREKLAEVQQDLARLSELGELPVEVIAEEGIIRVFFPNCDRERLEALLMEKNVVGGVIHEGDPEAGAGHHAVSPSESSSVSWASSSVPSYDSEYGYSEYDSASYELSNSNGLSGSTSYYLSTFTSSDAAMRRPSLSSGSTASSQDDILSSSSSQRLSRLNEISLFQPEQMVRPAAVHIVEEEPLWAM